MAAYVAPQKYILDLRDSFMQFLIESTSGPPPRCTAGGRYFVRRRILPCFTLPMGNYPKVRVNRNVGKGFRSIDHRTFLL